MSKQRRTKKPGPGGFGAGGSEAYLTMMTATPEDQVNWLLAFLEEDLAALTPAARAERGWRLRALKPAASTLRAWRRRERPQRRREDVVWVTRAPWTPLPDETIEALRRDIGAGVQNVLKGEPWPLPGTTGASLRRLSPRGHFEWTWKADDERSAILLGVAELIYDCGDRLRACGHCGRPFLAVKRQEYCTSEHGQLARDEKKKTRRRKGGAR